MGCGARSRRSTATSWQPAWRPAALRRTVCAAYLWKFRKFERPVVEVLVAKGHAPRLAGVTVRRTARLDPAEMTHIGAIPITSRPRTLLDLVSIAPDLVEGALDGALHRCRISLKSLEGLLER